MKESFIEHARSNHSTQHGSKKNLYEPDFFADNGKPGNTKSTFLEFKESSEHESVSIP